MQPIVGEGNHVLRIDALPGFAEREEIVRWEWDISRKAVGGKEYIDRANGRVGAEERLDVFVKIPIIGSNQHGVVQWTGLKLAIQIEVACNRLGTDIRIPDVEWQKTCSRIKGCGKTFPLPVIDVVIGKAVRQAPIREDVEGPVVAREFSLLRLWVTTLTAGSSR